MTNLPKNKVCNSQTSSVKPKPENNIILFKSQSKINVDKRKKAEQAIIENANKFYW